MNENEVIAALCTHLESTGYTIHRRLRTSERGVDVVAVHDRSGRRLLAEVKGATSARIGSSRFGRPFTSAQNADHVAKAVYAALCLRADRDNHVDVAIVVPDAPRFRFLLERITGLLESAGIEIMLINPDGSVAHLRPLSTASNATEARTRPSHGKKAATTRKRRQVARKAAVTRRRRAAARKAATTRKHRSAARKAVAARKKT